MGANDGLQHLTNSHGELTEAVFLEAYPNYRGFLVFKDGYRLGINRVPGTGLSGGFKFGYSGTGSDALRAFLLEAGFADAPVNSSSLPVPGRLLRDGSCTSITIEERKETPEDHAKREARVRARSALAQREEELREQRKLKTRKLP